MHIQHSINWFEIPTNDLARAITFYEKIFDITFKVEKMGDVDLAIFPADKEGIAGALIKADFLQPGEQGSLVYLNVNGKMDRVISAAQAQGANIYLAKMDIGECGWIAHIGDSEGNKIGLHSTS